MRIPKFVVLGGAVILGTIASLQAQRDDSDLQTRARDELHRKMTELDSTSSNKTPAPAAVIPVDTPMPSPAPMKVSPPPPPQAPPPVLTAPAMMAQANPPVYMEPPNPNRDKAEEMLRQKMKELDAEQATSQPPPKVAKMRPMTPPPATPVATPPASDDAKAKAEAEEVARTEAKLKAKADAKAKREAERKAKEDDKAKTQTQPQPTFVPVVERPAPMPPPAVPAVMTSKEQKLLMLLQQYRADQITPQQYHEQRARILAEP